MLKKLVKRSRSYRRFKGDKKIERETLQELVELARFSPSAANKQPLKFILANKEEKNAAIFPYLSWAGYLKNWDKPEAEKRPSAYIIMLNDSKINSSVEASKTDAGIAAQSMLLGAVEKGLGGCIFGALDRSGLREELQIDERYDILYVIALGEPTEKVKIETTEAGGDIEYWRDEDGIHHVPKRPLSELVLNY
ncbi:MAG: nitroreductase family protein [Halanaerobiaceae bacterium]